MWRAAANAFIKLYLCVPLRGLKCFALLTTSSTLLMHTDTCTHQSHKSTCNYVSGIQAGCHPAYGSKTDLLEPFVVSRVIQSTRISLNDRHSLRRTNAAINSVRAHNRHLCTDKDCRMRIKSRKSGWCSRNPFDCSLRPYVMYMHPGVEIANIRPWVAVNLASWCYVYT